MSAQEAELWGEYDARSLAAELSRATSNESPAADAAEIDAIRGRLAELEEQRDHLGGEERDTDDDDDDDRDANDDDDRDADDDDDRDANDDEVDDDVNDADDGGIESS